jgi:hypothetical protein
MSGMLGMQRLEFKNQGRLRFLEIAPDFFGGFQMYTLLAADFVSRSRSTVNFGSGQHCYSAFAFRLRSFDRVRL